jgi:hypothetical protein
VWDDDFGTDRTPAYRVDQPVPGEPAPALTVTGGALTATTTTRAFGVLAAPVPAGTRDTAVIVEPRAFSGAQPEDSLFLGLSAGGDDYALAWYNNHFGSSGADVEVAGAAHPEAAGSCCASVRWQPGDRFAVVLRAGHLTTWREHDDAWTLLHDAPLSTAVPPETAATWAPAMGLRLDAGTIALDRLTVRTREG